MPNWKKLIVSGSNASLNSLNVTTNVTAQSFTGSFSGSINTAISASYALTASYVNTLNQTVIITGSLGVGVGSLGSTENTLVLGPAPAGGSGEGGQILLQAQGGTYTSASMLDNYQNKFRLLRGTNAGSDGYKLQVDLQTGQLQLPNYNSTSAFTGTTLVGLVGFDSSGNLLTTQTSSAALSGGSTSYVARWASSSTLTTGSIYDTGTNVGIGTTSPGAKLHVAGGEVRVDAGQAVTLDIANSMYLVGASNQLRLYNGGNPVVNITTGGNVGIGTTSPATKLALAGSTATTFGLSLEPAGWNTAKHRLTVPISGDVSMWSFNWDGSSVDSALYAPASILLSQGTITFNTTGSANSPAPRMTINSTGNVGIGTSSPNSILEISQATPVIRIESSDVNQFHGIEFRNGGNLDAFIKQLPQSGEFKISNGRSTGWGGHITLYTDTAERMRITAAGNIGIGTTSPSQKLTVVGNTSISGVTYTDYVQTYSGTSIDFRHQDASTVMRVDTANARVGIGTTSPTATLEVNGNVKATSFTGSLSGSATNAVSASYALVATSASYALSSSYALTATTASYALTASFINPLNQNLIVTGSVIATGGITASNALINGNLTVVGTASFTYSTSSIVNVGASTITLNTDNPAVRFGGITVVDSGSFGTSSTGSLLWDSQNNRWVYSNPSGSTYDGGLLISGPRNTSGLGNEEGTTLNALMKGQGGDHITSSGVFEVSGSVGIGTSSPSYKLDVQGDVGIGVAGATTVHAYYNSTTRNQNVYTNNSSFEFHEGVNERVRIAAGGNVGIGTTAPESKLHVAGGQLTLKGGSTTDQQILFNFAREYVQGIYNSSGHFRLQDNSLGGTVYQWDGSTFAFPNGNVGIGTTSPGYKLDVAGATNTAGLYSRGANIGFESQIAALGTNGSYQAGYYLGATNTVYAARLGMDVNSGDVYLGIGNTGSLSTVTYFKANGNVGIGTTNPTSLLHISSSSGSPQGITIQGGDETFVKFIQGPGAVKNWGLITTNLAVDDFGIYQSNSAGGDPFSAGTARLYFDGSGNVGIGTTSPSSKLSILTDSGDSSGNAFSFTGYGSKQYVSISKLGFIRTRASDLNGANIHFLDNGGNNRMEMAVNTTSMTWYSHALSSNILVFEHTSGNIGIGTSSPGQKLDVAGAISVSGSVIDYEVSPGLIGPGPAVNIISFTPGTHYAAFVDYVIKDASTGANQRVGTIQVSISLAAAAAVMNEVTTIDIGNTSAITFAVSYGAPTWLTATNSGITPYDINYMVRYF